MTTKEEGIAVLNQLSFENYAHGEDPAPYLEKVKKGLMELLVLEVVPDFLDDKEKVLIHKEIKRFLNYQENFPLRYCIFKA